MPSKRTIALAVACIGLTAPLIQSVKAQSNDVRQEDRREDRREEVRLNVPRDANGAIDAQKLIAEIRALFDRGVREVRIREQGFTMQERAQIAQIVQRLAADLKLERVRVRQDDDRLRIELRNAREERVERREDRRADRREDRAERNERVARMERPERNERAERVERPDRSGRH